MLKKVFNWTILSKISIVFGVVLGLTSVFEWIIPESYQLKSTIETFDYNQPKILSDYLDSISYKKMHLLYSEVFEELKSSVNEEFVKSFSLVDSLSNRHISNLDIIENTLRKRIFDTLENSKKQTSKFHKYQSDITNLKKFLLIYDLTYLTIENNGESEVSDIIVDFGSNGYYEIESEMKVIDAGFFEKEIFLSPLRGAKKITIRIWANNYNSESIIITYPNGIIPVQEIVKTTGFYAWASQNLNTLSKVYLMILAPLYFIFLILYIIYRKLFSKKSNKSNIDNSVKEIDV